MWPNLLNFWYGKKTHFMSFYGVHELNIRQPRHVLLDFGVVDTWSVQIIVNAHLFTGLDVCVSVHHSIIHKENPTRCNSVSKFYFIFVWSSTCFRQYSAHYQKPKPALAASGFAYMEGCWICSWWALTASSNYTSNNPSHWQHPATTCPKTIHTDTIQQLHVQQPFMLTASSNYTSNNPSRWQHPATTHPTTLHTDSIQQLHVQKPFTLTAIGRATCRKSESLNV
jgi:hypothetical protein